MKKSGVEHQIKERIADRVLSVVSTEDEPNRAKEMASELLGKFFEELVAQELAKIVVAFLSFFATPSL